MSGVGMVLREYVGWGACVMRACCALRAALMRMRVRARVLRGCECI